MKLFWLKNKKIILIVLAIFFLVAIFIFKNQNLFKNEITYQKNSGQENGLVYSTITVEDLVNNDTDGDGIMDWEEGLWETDPTKTDTNGDGVPDSVEIAKLKAEAAINNKDLEIKEPEELTKTEKFSDQLISTITALEQSGTLDETTIDQITTSLAESIQTSVPRKIYTIKDIKINPDESQIVFQAYNIKLQALQNKYPLNENVETILSESMQDNGDIDVAVFKKFDPIIKQLDGIVKEMLTISPPKSLSLLHVMIINGFQKLSENLTDIKLVDSDAIPAFAAINQYEKNSARLQQYVAMLINAVNTKLNN